MSIKIFKTLKCFFQLKEKFNYEKVMNNFVISIGKITFGKDENGHEFDLNTITENADYEKSDKTFF